MSILDLQVEVRRVPSGLRIQLLPSPLDEERKRPPREKKRERMAREKVGMERRCRRSEELHTCLRSSVDCFVLAETRLPSTSPLPLSALRSLLRSYPKKSCE